MKRTSPWVAVSFFAWSACGAGQADEDYRGEPLMSLNGVVSTTSSPLTEGLVPALLMRESIFTITPSSPGTAHFIQGEVEGTFPNAFTLRVYDPPPPATIDTLFDGEPAFGIAMITAVSPAHPAWLRTETFTQPIENGEILGERICSESECLMALYDCPDGPTDPHRAWPCGSTFPEDKPWATYGYATNRNVVYFAGPVEAGSVLSHMYGGDQAITAGYHVFENVTPTQQQLDEQGECTRRADARALEEANRLNGTQWTSWPLDTPEQLRLRWRLGHEMVAAEGCAVFMRIVDGSEDAPVELEFIDDPSLMSFLL